MLNAYIEICTKVHFSSDRRTIIAHKSRTVGTPGVNLVSKVAGDTRGKSHERRARNFEWYRRTLKKRQGGGHNAPPPPQVS